MHLGDSNRELLLIIFGIGEFGPMRDHVDGCYVQHSGNMPVGMNGEVPKQLAGFLPAF